MAEGRRTGGNYLLRGRHRPKTPYIQLHHILLHIELTSDRTFVGTLRIARGHVGREEEDGVAITYFRVGIDLKPHVSISAISCYALTSPSIFSSGLLEVTWAEEWKGTVAVTYFRVGIDL